jgi:hypothetical protein
MKIQGKQLYVFMQCTCIDINMAELRESGESMQFLKIIEHANARMLNLLVVFCFVLKPVHELIIIMYITNYSSLFPMTN